MVWSTDIDRLEVLGDPLCEVLRICESQLPEIATFGTILESCELLGVEEEQRRIRKGVVHDLAHVLHCCEVSLDALEVARLKLLELVEVCLPLYLLLELLVTGLVEIHIFCILVEIFSIIYVDRKHGQQIHRAR